MSGERRVGLSWRSRPQGLLKIVGGQPREEIEMKKVREPASVDAPPLSTDDEDEDDDTGRPAGAQELDSSDEDDKRTTAANIQRTNFRPDSGRHEPRDGSRKASGTIYNEKKAPATPRGAPPTRRSSRQAGKFTPSTNTKLAKRAAQEDDNVASASDDSRASKRTKSNGTVVRDELGGHHARGFMSKPAAAKRVKTYRASTSARQEDVSSDDDSRSLRIGPRAPGTPQTPRGGLKIPTDTPGWTPDAVKTSFRVPDRGAYLEESPSKKNEILRVPSKKPKKQRRESLSEDEASQTAKLIIPMGYDAPGKECEVPADDEGSALINHTHDDEAPAILRIETDDSRLAVCPMCSEPVDREMLQSFSKKPRMSIGQQTKFCRMHKKKEAEEEWHSRGYPEIRWDKLESRIADHRRFLANLIEGGASHSADLLERNIKTGKSRTLFKTEESLTPGYYGLRGLRAMTEGIIKQFSALLKKRAVQDRLISARGHTSYVQTVLIPELCVEFIREDMRVDEKSARAVMKESRALGDLLNDDKGDTVHKLDEDSDEQVIGDRGNGRLDALDGEESDLSSLSDV